MPGDTGELAEEITTYVRGEVGDRLRGVVRYSSSDHDSIYTREDVSRQLQMDDETRTMFRTPLVQVNTTLTQVSRLAPTFADPAVAIIDFGNVRAFLIPTGPKEGIFLTLDREGDISEDLVAGCKEIVNESG